MSQSSLHDHEGDTLCNAPSVVPVDGIIGRGDDICTCGAVSHNPLVKCPSCGFQALLHRFDVIPNRTDHVMEENLTHQVPRSAQRIVAGMSSSYHNSRSRSPPSSRITSSHSRSDCTQRGMSSSYHNSRSRSPLSSRSTSSHNHSDCTLRGMSSSYHNSRSRSPPSSRITSTHSHSDCTRRGTGTHSHRQRYTFHRHHSSSHTTGTTLQRHADMPLILDMQMMRLYDPRGAQFHVDVECPMCWYKDRISHFRIADFHQVPSGIPCCDIPDVGNRSLTTDVSRQRIKEIMACVSLCFLAISSVNQLDSQINMQHNAGQQQHQQNSTVQQLTETDVAANN